MTVSDGKITGTLKKISTGALAETWGAGYFMAVKFTDNDDGGATISAGMDPSEGSGLVELDSDMNGVWKVTNKATQRFKVVATDGTYTVEKVFDLSELTLAD